MAQCDPGKYLGGDDHVGFGDVNSLGLVVQTLANRRGIGAYHKLVASLWLAGIAVVMASGHR